MKNCGDAQPSSSLAFSAESHPCLCPDTSRLEFQRAGTEHIRTELRNSRHFKYRVLSTSSVQVALNSYEKKKRKTKQSLHVTLSSHTWEHPRAGAPALRRAEPPQEDMSTGSYTGQPVSGVMIERSFSIRMELLHSGVRITSNRRCTQNLLLILQHVEMNLPIIFSMPPPAGIRSYIDAAIRKGTITGEYPQPKRNNQ